MPWTKLGEVPDNLRKLDDVALTLPQINDMAAQADAVEGADSGWAVARSAFKEGHKVEDGKWVTGKKEQSKNQEMDEIRHAFMEQFPEEGPNYEWPGPIYADHVIVDGSGKHYRVGYTKNEETYVFVPRPDWIPVEQAWLPARKALCEKCGLEYKPKEKELICETCQGKVEKDHSGAMLAFYVPQDVAKKLVEYAAQLPEGSEVSPPDEMHVTLAYVPQLEVDTLDMVKVAEGAAGLSFVADGKIGGIGRFSTEQGMDPVYVPVDVPGLEEVRENILGQLKDAGQPPSDSHGFSPHITLGYVPSGAKVDVVVPDIPIQFDRLALAFGKTRQEFVLRQKTSNVLRLFSGIIKALITNGDVVSVWKDSKGQRWYFAGISSSVKDYEGETVTAKGIDYAISLARKHDYHSGTYVEHEVPATRVGTSVAEFRVGKRWIEIGKLEDSDLAQLAYKRLEAGDARLSIGFLALASEKKAGKYTKLWKYDTSIVSKPANPLTFIVVGGKGSMDDRVKKVLATLAVSDEEKEQAESLLADLLAEVKSETETVVKAKTKKAMQKELLEMLEENAEAKALAAKLYGMEEEPEEEEKAKAPPEGEEDEEAEAKAKAINDQFEALSKVLTGIKDSLDVLPDLDTRLKSLESDQTMTQVVAKLVERLNPNDPKREAGEKVDKAQEVLEEMAKQLGESDSKYQLDGFFGAAKKKGE